MVKGKREALEGFYCTVRCHILSSRLHEATVLMSGRRAYYAVGRVAPDAFVAERRGVSIVSSCRRPSARTFGRRRRVDPNLPHLNLNLPLSLCTHGLLKLVVPRSRRGRA